MTYVPSKSEAPVPRRFTAAPTAYGYEVVDADGRPVASEQDELSAGIIAATLNGAAAAGPRSLARALGATEG
jgi:hypothetical protein